MARPDKVAAVAEIADEFRGASASVVTEYRGLTVAQLTKLRRTLGPDVSYRIAKNTLVKRAAQDAGVDGLDALLTGPTAIAFVTGEPVDAAKVLREFAKDNKALVIKGGFMDGKLLSAEEIGKLADLESREVLLSKLAGAMNASLQTAVSLFAAPLSQTARVVEALRAKVEEQGPAFAEDPAAEAPAAEAEAEAAADEPADAPAEAETPETTEA